MSRFVALFKRSHKHSKQPKEAHQSDQNVQEDSSIANLPVAGMQRSNQGTYMTTYAAPRPQQDLNKQKSSASTLTDSSRTAVDTKFVSQNGDSAWKGAPNGKAYDKREELSSEDEDMWAKMAM